MSDSWHRVCAYPGLNRVKITISPLRLHAASSVRIPTSNLPFDCSSSCSLLFYYYKSLTGQYVRQFAQSIRFPGTISLLLDHMSDFYVGNHLENIIQKTHGTYGHRIIMEIITVYVSNDKV